MKSFNDYLTESQKTYSFKVKVAGQIPEKFVETVKSRLEKYGCSKFSQVGSTPIQATAMDFPELCNVEVTMFEAECSYPVTPPEILLAIKNSVAISETHVRVRNARESEELDALALDNAQPSKKAKALLDDPDYKEAEKYVFHEEIQKCKSAWVLGDLTVRPNTSLMNDKTFQGKPLTIGPFFVAMYPTLKRSSAASTPAEVTRLSVRISSCSFRPSNTRLVIGCAFQSAKSLIVT
jgi:hypothetical protein